MYHWYQSFKCNGWKFLKKWSCNSEFHAQAIIMYQSFYFFFGGARNFVDGQRSQRNTRKETEAG